VELRACVAAIYSHRADSTIILGAPEWTKDALRFLKEISKKLSEATRGKSTSNEAAESADISCGSVEYRPLRLDHIFHKLSDSQEECDGIE